MSTLDLGTQFYCSEAEVGQNRASISASVMKNIFAAFFFNIVLLTFLYQKIAELNPHHVKVQAAHIDLSVDANLSALDMYKVTLLHHASCYCYLFLFFFMCADSDRDRRAAEHTAESERVLPHKGYLFHRRGCQR